MSPYTKGPWDYATRTENDILISVRINDASHATVCTVHGSTSPMNDQYVGASKLTANVRLICSAPDLLDALKLLLAEVNGNDLSQEESDRLDHAIEMAQSAIAKATTIQ